MNKDKVVWSSSSYRDWCWEAPDEEIIDAYNETSWGSNDEEITVDEMREYFASDYDYDPDYEDMEWNVAPSIASHCYADCLWLIGNYQRWNGGHQALAYYSDAEDGIISVCYPDYDSTSMLIDVDGDLAFTEYTHDTPTGGTMMYLYSFKDQAAWDAAEEYINTEYTEKDSDGNDRHIPEYWGYEASIDDLAEDYDAVKDWIDHGWLTPIKANIYE